jgi:hypothetical protein
MKWIYKQSGGHGLKGLGKVRNKGPATGPIVAAVYRRVEADLMDRTSLYENPLVATSHIV